MVEPRAPGAGPSVKNKPAAARGVGGDSEDLDRRTCGVTAKLSEEASRAEMGACGLYLHPGAQRGAGGSQPLEGGHGTRLGWEGVQIPGSPPETRLGGEDTGALGRGGQGQS